MEIYKEHFVFVLLRIALGALFFFQAYDKFARIGLRNVSSEVSAGNSDKGIPTWFSRISVYISSYIELIAGLLLIFGIFTNIMLYLLGIHMIMLFFAFGYLQGLWDMRYVFPRFAILITLFLLPSEWNTLSIDFLMM